jgi:aquaporin Z
MNVDITRRALAEFIGTFWLVFGGCGAAIISAGFPGLGIGFLGVAFAFGLTVLTMVYAIGHVSGAHLNPAVSLGLWAVRRFPARDLVPYIVAQCLGAIVAALVLYLIASGQPGFIKDGFAANGYGAHSPGGYSLLACLVAEVVTTFMFLVVIIGATDKRAQVGALGGVGIGLALTLIHLITIPVTNTSVNPARSLGPALIAGGWALQQLWLFIVAPVAGGLLAGLFYVAVYGRHDEAA